ncbi:hypothetical protein [Lactovum odontotermitis]
MAKYKKKSTPFMTFVKVVIVLMFLIMIIFTVGGYLMSLPIFH